MDQCSTVSSFYEPPEIYDEGKTNALYNNLKTNFQDIRKSLKSIDKDMSHIQKQSLLTMKLIEKIKTAETSVSENSTSQ